MWSRQGWIWALLLSSIQYAPTQSLAISESSEKSNDSLLWGPYRPNLYFGVRPRIPKSLSTGLLWAKVNTYDGGPVQNNFRYTCEQNEGMAGYGWDEYDIRYGGKQTIHDSGNLVDITTEFVKIPGGQHGGHWAVRVKGSPRENDGRPMITTILLSAALEGLGELKVETEQDEYGVLGDVRLRGSTPELGEFTLDVLAGPETNKHPPQIHDHQKQKPSDRTIISSLQVQEDQLWQAKPLIFQMMKPEIEGAIEEYGKDTPPPPWSLYTVPAKVSDGNFHVVQKVFEGAFEFDIIYTSASAGDEITTHWVTNQLQYSKEMFLERFSRLMLPSQPYNKVHFLPFAKTMFSNLLGGIGYFYGDSVVDRSYAPEYDEDNEGFWEETAAARARQDGIRVEGPSELFTSIPSRPFFPRGFLWDEGFHLLPIADWDMDVTLGIVSSWFKLIDKDGWIAREQILGHEARSKVPQEFTVQYPHYANPPTLFLILETLIDKIHANTQVAPSSDPLDGIRTSAVREVQVAKDYLTSLYPSIKRHYFWFRRTQRGDVKSYDREAFSTKEAYRWRGRTERHILPSGLDDYPRPQPPHPGELHTDLISWIGMMTRSIRRVADFIGEADDVAEYQGYEKAILRNIDDLHWSAKEKIYCDASIDEYEENTLICHKGYISIFPFLTGLLPPDSPRLGPILQLIHDPEELWSPYGIRSLSVKDEHYGTDENYWRSPIWMPLNYMALQSLQSIALSSAANNPHKIKAARMYNELRKNLVENVYEQWQKTGFAWEQYNPETGAGQRTQHFTGWTSLVVKIMNMDRLDEETLVAAADAPPPTTADAIDPEPEAEPEPEEEFEHSEL